LKLGAKINLTGLFLSLLCVTSAAQEPVSSVNFSLANWNFGRYDQLTGRSILNPGNVSRFPRQSFQNEVRANVTVRKTFENWELFGLVDPRFVLTRNWISTRGNEDAGNRTQVTLKQAYAQIRGEKLTLTGGRQVLTWGPGSFRSPSNPFYLSYDKTNPLLDLAGVDNANLSVDLGPWRLTSGYVYSNRATKPRAINGNTDNSVLAKLDYIGSNWLLSLNGRIDTRNNSRSFLGAYGQYTLDDAWLLYFEGGVTRPDFVLRANPLASLQQFSLEPGRELLPTGLIGLSYTFASGPVLTLEYLRSQNGMTTPERQIYFTQLRAAHTPFALLNRPDYFGRDYVWVGLRNSPQDLDFTWRLDAAFNLSDRSAGLQAYVEKNVFSRAAVFANVGVGIGSKATEFGGLYRLRVMGGIKLFIF
jgi:hypothetical protein